MTFAEILEEVYLITNRRDLEAQTKSAIKKATLKAHQSDFYYRDLYETGMEFDEPNHKQYIDLNSTFANFNAINYIKRVENENDEQGVVFTEVTPDNVVDDYGYLKRDVYYVAGRNIELRASCAFDKVLVGLYVLPVLTEEDYSSWVADLVPYFIVHEAARTVLRVIGYLEESNAQRAEVAEQLKILKQIGLATTGY
ncbi:MAG: hypothetical protein CMK07_13530 [Ponticaulis sp.]|nr:hypothetical protein [Ponticaulis sp.]|tara:strand:+ start:927 stop:1517 length:591 start_codon:yes stop_codon:yes gene_type:complete